MTVFEALLTTGQSEISHQVAERVAIILAKDADSRMALYKEIKSLYSLRSEIVHGKIKRKKGMRTRDHSWVSATDSNVSQNLYVRLTEISNDLINHIIHDSILNCIYDSRDVDRDLDQYFLKRIFSGK